MWNLVPCRCRAVCARRSTRATLDANFTNEGGLAGTWRYLRNAAGLWLIEECRRAGQNRVARSATRTLASGGLICPRLRWLFDVDDPALFLPGDMPIAIQRAVSRVGSVPATPGDIARCILESLALRYRKTLVLSLDLTGRTISEIRLFGGGSRSAALSANGGRVRTTGHRRPAEATAIGNALAQMLALGEITSSGRGTRRGQSLASAVESTSRATTSGWAEAEARLRPAHSI